jgi:hypothetical protein
MRERRWESRTRLEFDDVLALGRRLAALGLKPATPTKDIICYIEDWPVESPEDLVRMDPWVTEDVTFVHSHEGWQGDFFLLAGSYHTVYQRHQEVGTYCSISHPWKISEPLSTHHPGNMFWLGFSHAHAFIRVRLHTTDVITPGETRGDDRRALWVDERRRAFLAAIKVLDLPIEPEVERGSLVLKPFRPDAPFFCSWPDAFGPCQFELNSSDVFEFLVPAGRLAATHGSGPAMVRAYLTGFSAPALEEFASVHPGARYTYRCSAHCPLGDVPDILQAIRPGGRLYATLCEFRSQQFLPNGEDAYAIVGVMGLEGGFKIEVRLNRAPLPEDAVAGWLEALVGMPLAYAPLSPFP